MSLWTCPEHGLYGGNVFCPECGGTGAHTTLTGSYERQTNLPLSVIEAGEHEAIERALRIRIWNEQRERGVRQDAAIRAVEAEIAAIKAEARTANETGKVER